MPKTILMILIALMMTTAASAEDDWEVTTPGWKKQAQKFQVLYGGIKDFEKWQTEFKKVFDKGDVAATRFLLKLAKDNRIDFDINAKDDRGRTLLHSAVALRKSEMAKTLLSFGADVAAADDDGNHPLHLAIKALSVANVDLLLKTKDVDINAQTKQGEPPIGLAVSGKNEAIIKKIMELKPNLDFEFYGSSFKDWVIKKDNVEGFKLFYPKIDVKNLEQDEDGMSLLHRAAKFDAARITSYLLNLGVDARLPYYSQDRNGDDADESTTKPKSRAKLALDYAAINGHIATIEAYLKHDRDLVNRVVSTNNDRLIHYAIDTANFDLLDVLLKYKPDLSLENKNGEQPLDALIRIKNTADVADKAFMARLVKYEKLLIPTGPKSTEKFKQAIAIQDVKTFVVLLEQVQSHDLLALFNDLVSARKTKLIAALLKERTIPSQYYSNPELFTDSMWPVFETIYRAEKGEDFQVCNDQYCPKQKLLLSVSTEFLKKFFKLPLPPHLKSHGDFFTEDNLREIDLTIELAENNLKYNVSLYGKTKDEADLKRLESIRTVLSENGILTPKFGLHALAKLHQLLPADKGAEILNFYTAKTLAGLTNGEAMRLAILYDDVKLAAALAPYIPENQKIKEYIFTASEKMKPVMTKYKMAVPDPMSCAELIEQSEEAIGHERFLAWITTSQLVGCLDLNESLLYAISSGNEKLVDAMLAIPKVVESAKKQSLNHVFKSAPLSALHTAVQHCNVSIVAQLLALGFDPNSKSANGTTPLLVLAPNQRVLCSDAAKIIDLLIKAGADVNKTDDNGNYALLKMMRYKEKGAFDFLLEAGVPLFPSDSKSNEPSAAEWAALDYDRSSYYYKAIKSKGLNPNPLRSCVGRSYSALIKNRSAVAHLNDLIHEYKSKEKKAAQSESCEDIKQRVATEHTAAALLFSQHVANWKRLALKLRHKMIVTEGSFSFDGDSKETFAKEAGFAIDHQTEDSVTSSFCCGYNENQRCLSQISCDSQKDAREFTAPFCDKHANSSQTLAALKLKIHKKRTWEADQNRQKYIDQFKVSSNRLLFFDLENGLTDDPVFSLIIPTDIEPNEGFNIVPLDQLQSKKPKISEHAQRRVVEKIIDAQLAGLYDKMGLSNLRQYVSWKYPHCLNMSRDQRVKTERSIQRKRFQKLFGTEKSTPTDATEVK